MQVAYTCKIDAADEACSNWMRYVNCARHYTEQNVIGFQYKGQLYYKTCKDIENGEELLVYYGRNFAKNLGIDTKKYFEPNSEEVDTDYFCCEFCMIGLSTKEYKDMHQKRCRFRPIKMVVYTQEDNFVCQYCKCALTKQEYLKKHETFCSKNPKRGGKSCKKERTFQCSHCGKMFKESYHLVQHELIHKKETKFACTKCPYKTTTSLYLRRHEKNHANCTFKCHECQIGFHSKQQLDGHFLSKHENLRHMVTSKVHKCHMCNYETVQSTHFKYHTIIHNKNNSEKFYCDRCEYSSFWKSYLKRHFLTHSTKKKPYVCKSCGKDFIRKQLLDSHILSNHRDNENLMRSLTSKVHSCHICHFKSVVKTNFTKHVATHKKKQSVEIS